ncbi:MAG: metal-dependent transcriptional regulator [Candidatus Coproplasma sp.]
MKHNQSAEDYLETILLLSKELEDVHQIEIARRIGVSQPAVQKALRILKSQGYIIADGLHICLTERGREYAERVYHRHCTIRSFLILHGVEYDVADADACEIEHCISQQSFAAMERFVEENKATP